MIAPADLAHCAASIRTGSYSFHAASRLLPASVRNPALALYGFCRLADDEVDEGAAKAAAVLQLQDRLDAIYQGRPRNAPEDRAMAGLIAQYDMPRTLPDALLEGLAWDAEGRRYQTLSDVLAYSARVAAVVGAMMSVLMGVRDADRLARACDLGLAMQLTNIARDIGEDARAGRIYLPLDWLEAEGIAPAAFLADPRPCPAIAGLTRRLLREADRLYARAEPGIAVLPLACRPGIFAASAIYRAIGGQIAARGHDSISVRARTTRGHKLALIGRAVANATTASVMPRAATLHAGPMPEVAYLVEASCTETAATAPRSDRLIATLAQLRARDMSSRDGASRQDYLQDRAASGG